MMKIKQEKDEAAARGGGPHCDDDVTAEHATISSSVACFSSCPQSFPASVSFPISQLFTSGSQSIGTSASVLLKNVKG